MKQEAVHWQAAAPAGRTALRALCRTEVEDWCLLPDRQHSTELRAGGGRDGSAWVLQRHCKSLEGASQPAGQTATDWLATSGLTASWPLPLS